MLNDLQNEVQRLSNFSKVTNTDKNTEKWLHHVTRYIKEHNIQKNLDQIDNREELDKFLTVEEDLEEYYNYPGESYITYESEEDSVEAAEISVTSTTATGSKSDIEVTAISNNGIDKSQSLNTQENRSYNSQEDQLYNNTQEIQPCNTQEYHQKNQSHNTQESQSYRDPQNEFSDNLSIAQNHIKPRSVLEPVTNNIILHIPPTDKSLTINLTLTF
ncbi:20427_t:CDS:2, partial [Gigaspora margarita]